MYNKSTCVKLTALLITVFLMIPIAGCVERHLTINTSPPGALVTLNDEQIGNSPVTVGFNWYGDYRVSISKQGYETLNTHRELARPLHDKFPFDFFAQVLWPKTIEDEHQWDFTLTPYKAADRDELIDKANKMQLQATPELDNSAQKAE
ncbi:MAG: PEGA domain-containing protein [Anaerohalosphaera sp.]|nr:PEGA domain-containing protein [Anaerohalosphaera sp.]